VRVKQNTTQSCAVVFGSFIKTGAKAGKKRCYVVGVVFGFDFGDCRSAHSVLEGTITLTTAD
jgi:hypothetical protein